MSDDEDPDFGLKAKEAVKKEVMEEEKAKEKGKGKGKSKPKDRVKVDEEDEKKNSKKKKTKILVSPDEDSDEQPPGRSSEGALVDAARKRFRLDSGSDADEPKPKRRSTGSYKRVGKQVDLITDTPDEIDKHLKSLWRSPWQKRNPEMMSKGRKRMEEKYNKLVGLLGSSFCFLVSGTSSVAPSNLTRFGQVLPSKSSIATKRKGDQFATSLRRLRTQLRIYQATRTGKQNLRNLLRLNWLISIMKTRCVNLFHTLLCTTSTNISIYQFTSP